MASVQHVALEQPKWESYPALQAHLTSLNLLEMGASALKHKLMMVGNPAILQACMDALALRDTNAVNWMLTFLYEMVREDCTCFNVFEDGLKKNGKFCSVFVQILNNGDKQLADKAAWLSSAIMAHVPQCFCESDVNELLQLLHLSFLNAPGDRLCSELGCLEALTNLLKSDSFRSAVWTARAPLGFGRDADGQPKRLVKEFITKNLDSSEGSVLYKSVFAVWLLSSDGDAAQELKDAKIVSKLKEILTTCRVEKVVRITLATLKNLLPNKQLCSDVVETNILDSVQNLEYEKWRDAELYDEIREMSSSISTEVQETSNFERYETELLSGSLSWGYTHTSKFWGENIMKLDKNDYRVVKTLAALLIDANADVLTLAVACHDVGEFVALHPQGKKKVAELGIKERIMELMGTSGEEKRELRREALLCCQKIMLNKWQEASKTN